MPSTLVCYGNVASWVLASPDRTRYLCDSLRSSKNKSLMPLLRAKQLSGANNPRRAPKTTLFDSKLYNKKGLLRSGTSRYIVAKIARRNPVGAQPNRTLGHGGRSHVLLSRLESPKSAKQGHKACRFVNVPMGSIAQNHKTPSTPPRAPCYFKECRSVDRLKFKGM